MASTINPFDHNMRRYPVAVAVALVNYLPAQEVLNTLNAVQARDPYARDTALQLKQLAALVAEGRLQ